MPEHIACALVKGLVLGLVPGASVVTALTINGLIYPALGLAS
jgi:hypothetical protein